MHIHRVSCWVDGLSFCLHQNSGLVAVLFFLILAVAWLVCTTLWKCIAPEVHESEKSDVVVVVDDGTNQNMHPGVDMEEEEEEEEGEEMS